MVVGVFHSQSCALLCGLVHPMIRMGVVLVGGVATIRRSVDTVAMGLLHEQGARRFYHRVPHCKLNLLLRPDKYTKVGSLGSCHRSCFIHLRYCFLEVAFIAFALDGVIFLLFRLFLTQFLAFTLFLLLFVLIVLPVLRPNCLLDLCIAQSR